MRTRLKPGDRIYVKVKTTGGYVGTATVIRQLDLMLAVQYLLDRPEHKQYLGFRGHFPRSKVIHQKVTALENVRLVTDSPMPAEHREYLEELQSLSGPLRQWRCNRRLRQRESELPPSPDRHQRAVESQRMAYERVSSALSGLSWGCWR